MAWLLPFFIALLPFAVMGAYEPGALLSLNNLSDVASAAIAWTNLGGGTAGKKTASDNTQTDVASVKGSIVSGHCADFADTSGTVQDAGAACGGSGASWTTTTYSSNTSTLTLGTTNLNVELIAQGTPAALTIDLPVVSGLSNGFTECVKDKANNFGSNTATVKTTDSTTIDGVAGSTGFVMNQNKQANCFVTDATNWYVE